MAGIKLKYINTLLAALTITLLVAANTYLSPNPVVYTNQSIDIVSQKHPNSDKEDITVRQTMTIEVKEAYNAQISWVISCLPNYTLDVGRKNQSRVPGRYTIKNIYNVPQSIIGKNCTVDSIFSWKPTYSIFEKTITSNSLAFKINTDGTVIAVPVNLNN